MTDVTSSFGLMLAQNWKQILLAVPFLVLAGIVGVIGLVALSGFDFISGLGRTKADGVVRIVDRQGQPKSGWSVSFTRQKFVSITDAGGHAYCVVDGSDFDVDVRCPNGKPVTRQRFSVGTEPVHTIEVDPPEVRDRVESPEGRVR